MTIGNFLEGLSIFVKYYNDGPKNYALGADHDVIYIYPTDVPIVEDDVKALIKLGFTQLGVGPDEVYLLREGWVAYV